MKHEKDASSTIRVAGRQDDAATWLLQLRSRSMATAGPAQRKHSAGRGSMSTSCGPAAIAQPKKLAGVTEPERFRTSQSTTSRVRCPAATAASSLPHLHHLPQLLPKHCPQLPLNAHLERGAAAGAAAAGALQRHRHHAPLHAHHRHVAPVSQQVGPHLLKRSVN
jgi:hypothetical protein